MDFREDLQFTWIHTISSKVIFSVSLNIFYKRFEVGQLLAFFIYRATFFFSIVMSLVFFIVRNDSIIALYHPEHCESLKPWTSCLTWCLDSVQIQSKKFCYLHKNILLIQVASKQQLFSKCFQMSLITQDDDLSPPTKLLPQ